MSPPQSQSQSKSQNPKSLETVLKERNVAILADTVHSETLSVHDHLSGSWLSLPSIVELLPENELAYHTWVAAKKTLDKYRDRGCCSRVYKQRHARALNQFLLEVGIAISDRTSGPYFTFVDPRRHDNIHAMVEDGKRQFQLLRQEGFKAGDILISIPATEAGLQAAQLLQKCHGVNVNLYLVSSLIHAAACAETGAAAISVPVEKILEWFERRRGSKYPELASHPGIEAIQSIMTYFKLNKINTKIIGTNFRKMAEIGLLADFDAVCVSKYQVDRLRWSVSLMTPQIHDDSSTVMLRARQARYPTTLLLTTDHRDEDKGAGAGFMKTLSPNSRNLIKTVLYETLVDLANKMDTIEKAVIEEVERHFRFGTLDLKTLYGRPMVKTTTSTTRTLSGRTSKGSTGSADGSDEPEPELLTTPGCTIKTKTATNLMMTTLTTLHDIPGVQDEDEVF